MRVSASQTRGFPWEYGYHDEAVSFLENGNLGREWNLMGVRVDLRFCKGFRGTNVPGAIR